MAQNRPDKPQITLPDYFSGMQEPFSSSLVESGYEASIPQIIEGGNLNWMLNGLFQNTKYMRTVLDYVRDTPVGKMFWVNSQGQMDYIQPAIIATNTEFSTGTATDKTPNVKQVVDKFATKADDNTVVKLTGNQTIGGTKTFSKTISGSINGNAATVTNGVYTTGNQTIAGTKTFSSTISGSINGNAATVTNGVYTSGNQTIAGTKTFSTTPVVGTKGNSDNSTSAASTAYVKNILAALYPVGSIYIGTQSSCPLATLISGSNWEKVATSLVTEVSIPSTIAVYGNGKTLGLNDGSTNVGLFASGNTTYGIEATADLFNVNKGTGSSGSWLASDKGLGVTTSTNGSSGLIAKSNSITRATLTVNVWRRTA